MITSEVEQRVVNSEPDYPACFKCIEYGRIVIFTSLNEGTVIKQGSSRSHIGYHTHEWSDCTDVDTWEPFFGKVTITSK